MAFYRVHFLDHGDNVYATHHAEHDDDDAAISAAHRMNVLPHLGAGFEVWGGRTTCPSIPELMDQSESAIEWRNGDAPSVSGGNR